MIWSARPPVVVLGLDCPNGLQTTRVFAHHGVPVVGVTTRPRHPCVRTRLCTRKIRAAPRPDGLVATLLAWPEQFEAGSVIVPCTDRAVLDVARHGTALSRRFRSAVPSPDVIERLLDKARFTDFATANGLPIPATRVLRSRGDAEAASASLTFPCVLKPAIKGVVWERNAPAKAVMVDRADALPILYDRFAPWTDEMVVQEWIPGGDGAHYTCDCYVARGGEPLVTWVTRKLRQWPPVVGQACLSVECRNDDVRDETLRVLRAAGHYGQGYVEMKWDARSERHLIIEANVGRPTGRSTAAEKGGVELLMTMYCDLVGAPLPVDRTQHYRGSKWIHVRRDVQACAHALIHRRSGPREILRSWRGPFAFALFSRRDPVPFLADLAATLWRFLRTAIRLGTHAGGVAFGPHVRSDTGRPQPQPPLTPVVRGVATPRAGTLDFEVRGVLRIRAHGMGPGDLAAIRRDLMPSDATAGEPPDLIVQFVDDLSPRRLSLLDGGTMGYGDGGVYFLDSSGRTPIARVSQGEGWGEARIVCRRGLGRVPFLSAAIDLAALRSGWVPLHGSAWVTEEGTGVLVTGWAGSGKTGALLAACETGATPVGDDRILLSADGSRMMGLGRPILVKDWHLAQRTLRWIGARTGRRALARAALRVSGQLDRSGSTWTRWPSRALGRLRRELSVEIDPRELCRPLDPPDPARPDVLIMLETHRHPKVIAESVDPRTSPERIAAQVESELMPALRAHACFRYACPGRGWRDVGRAGEMAADILKAATPRMETFLVRHPHPCSLEELDEVIAALGGGRVPQPMSA